MYVYIDLDSTLNNFLYAWIDYCNEVTGKNYTVKDVKEWGGLVKLYPEDIVWKFFYSEPYKRNLIKPLPGASNFVRSLKELGFDVTIITHTPDIHISEKAEWIEKYFPGFPYILVDCSKSKPEVLEHNKLVDSVVIDDCPYVIADFVNYPIKKAFMFNYQGMYDYIYTTGIHTHEKVEVATDYNHILSTLQSIISIGK